jgi:MOSC domain-containing protein YiiM
VDGPIFVSATNLAGDRQADLVHHGGTDKAVLAYSTVHFAYWRDEFPDWQLAGGAFGENLTIEGLCEADVCVGDVFEIGACRVQVSQPRQPCWKLSRRWNLPRLDARVKTTGRTGWYLRVLQEGWIEAGLELQLVERPHPKITVAWANSVMYAKPRVPDNDRALAACPALGRSLAIPINAPLVQVTCRSQRQRSLGSYPEICAAHGACDGTLVTGRGPVLPQPYPLSFMIVLNSAELTGWTDNRDPLRNNSIAANALTSRSSASGSGRVKICSS